MHTTYPPLVLANQLDISAIPDSNKAKGYMLEMEAGGTTAAPAGTVAAR